MRFHYLQHVPYQTPGIIGEFIREQHHVLTRTQLFRDPSFPEPQEVDFLVVLGGPMQPNDETEYPWISREKQFIERTMGRSVAILGIGLGAQMIASVLGADVYRARYGEYGWWPVDLTPEARNHPSLRDWPEQLEVFHWHQNTFDLPEGASRVARSQGCENQGFLYDGRVLGLQFLPEIRPVDLDAMLEFAGDPHQEEPYGENEESIRKSIEKAKRVNTLLEKTLGAMIADLPTGIQQP